jgi:glucose/arabinose dehydrogenase
MAPAAQISAVSKASTPVMPAAATPSAAPTSKPAPEAAPKSKSVPPPQPSTSAALPDVALSGGKWLKALPADTWVVEHGNWGTLEQAQKLKAKYKELGTARIIAMRKSPGADEWQFIVVTGPFRSEVRAKTYISRLDWKANTRIRDTDKLKAQIAP